MLWYHNVFAEYKTKQRSLVIDFDGTIAVDSYPDIGDPELGVKKAFEQLKEAGFEIVIFTCRLNKRDGRSSREIEKHEIPYDKIDRGHDGKPFGVAMIDNKAMHYGGKDDWESITKRLLAEKDSLS